MVDLRTEFAGLKLKNPIIISSSGLTGSADKNEKLEMAGAGAIVLKSLFEEQIMLKAQQTNEAAYYPEGGNFLTEHLNAQDLADYLKLIQESKKRCSIPIIASINCCSNKEWVEFARKIEFAGADALELNILSIQASPYYECGEFERRHIDILNSVKSKIHIPVIIKLGIHLTNPISLVSKLRASGAEGIVMFNRLYQTDIDIKKMEFISGEVLSSASDLTPSLRWIGISSATVGNIDYAASGGVHSAEGAIKSILVGASAAEICSVIYKNGNQCIHPMLQYIECWMRGKGYENISQFKGLLKAKDVNCTNMYERTQFLRYFSERE
jgi:dihydroorotate dehydrogenase (fumarate)